jgi:hypothetical protein
MPTGGRTGRRRPRKRRHKNSNNNLTAARATLKARRGAAKAQSADTPSSHPFLGGSGPDYGEAEQAAAVAKDAAAAQQDGRLPGALGGGGGGGRARRTRKYSAKGAAAAGAAAAAAAAAEAAEALLDAQRVRAGRILDPATGYTAVLRDLVSSRPRLAALLDDHEGRADLLDNRLVDAQDALRTAKEVLAASNAPGQDSARGGGRAADRRKEAAVAAVEAARDKERLAAEAAATHHAAKPPSSETVELLHARRQAAWAAFNAFLLTNSVVKPPST